MTEPMLALSIRQPWAWAIIHAGKDVENRSENMARRAEPLIGQIILIHAGKSLDLGGLISAWINSCSKARVTSGCAMISADLSTNPQAEPCRWRRRDAVAREGRTIRPKFGGTTSSSVNALLQKARCSGFKAMKPFPLGPTVRACMRSPRP